MLSVCSSCVCSFAAALAHWPVKVKPSAHDSALCKNYTAGSKKFFFCCLLFLLMQRSPTEKEKKNPEQNKYCRGCCCCCCGIFNFKSWFSSSHSIFFSSLGSSSNQRNYFPVCGRRDNEAIVRIVGGDKTRSPRLNSASSESSL